MSALIFDFPDPPDADGVLRSAWMDVSIYTGMSLTKTFGCETTNPALNRFFQSLQILIETSAHVGPFVGHDPVASFRFPPRTGLDWQFQYNTSFNSVRASVGSLPANIPPDLGDFDLYFGFEFESVTLPAQSEVASGSVTNGHTGDTICSLVIPTAWNLMRGVACSIIATTDGTTIVQCTLVRTGLPAVDLAVSPNGSELSLAPTDQTHGGDVYAVKLAQNCPDTVTVLLGVTA